jgi:hypothetical protein
VLTVESGKTYEVSGDTSQLQANVGHQVRLSGSKGSTGVGSNSSASGQQQTFAVKTVDSISDHCKLSRARTGPESGGLPAQNLLDCHLA